MGAPLPLQTEFNYLEEGPTDINVDDSKWNFLLHKNELIS
jgi:hypothetical protein